jgi:hypothetical protein
MDKIRTFIYNNTANTGINHFLFDMSNLPGGVYIIKKYTNETVDEENKIVIE